MKRQLIPTLCLLLCLSAVAAVKPVDNQTITLKPGWNLVTVERPVIDADTEKFLALKPMMLDTARKCYVICTDRNSLGIGTGYWIFSHTAQTLELTRAPNMGTWHTATLTDGWNLIGVSNDSTWMNQATAIWQWLNDRFQIGSKDELTDGKAYWVE